MMAEPGTGPGATSGEPTVAELMRRDVPIVAPGDAIATVAQRMVESGVPGVVVVEEGELIGIITEADLIGREAEPTPPAIVPWLDAIFVADAGPEYDDELRRVLAVTARELMTTPVYNIRTSATLSQVATLMIDRRVNPVPVVDDQLHIVGIVSRADLVRVIAQMEAAGDASGTAEQPVLPDLPAR